MSKNKHNIHTLKEQITNITEQYLVDIDGHNDTNIYKKIIDVVEESFLQTLLKHTNGNQKEASEISGISRNTIRKKLEKHKIQKK
ncbi:MAG: Fis family transcriptional regulator [Legionellales bacterium]|jgi:Fis family transcriptional regulator, factor for inversion stimulation protein|nr:Fis family transcriptional regulator [Legionellales bacterium]